MKSPQKTQQPSRSFLLGLGLKEALGVSVAGMGPTLAMNLNPQEPSKHVGHLVPLIFAMSTLLLLMVAWCFGRLASKYPNAGSAYGFVSSVMGSKAGLFAGWALFGTYLSFVMVGIAGFGLFRSDLADKFHPLHHPSVFFFTMVGAVIVAILSITATRRAVLALITLEGIAVIAMVILSVSVIWKIFHGMGPQGDVSVSALFVPPPGITPSAIGLALSFGFLSFAGFEEVATLGEEAKQPRFTIPRVLFGTVIGGGLVYTLVTTAEVLGFGTDPAGMAHFAASDSLLGGLGSHYFGAWCGDLMDLLATCSALGCGLAAVLAASRVLFAIMRVLAPASPLARLSGTGATPVYASLLVIAMAFAGYALMRIVFHASGSDPFFWASTMGALGLLVAYLLVVVSAAISLIRVPEVQSGWKIVIPCVAAFSIAYTIWVNVYPVQSGAYGVIPWLVVVWCLLPLLFLQGRSMIQVRKSSL